MSAWGAIIGGVAEAAGAAYSAYASTKESGKQRKQARRAHRYEVEDLRAAGLNPILSAKYGGSATPSGMAQIPNIGSAAVSGAKKGLTAKDEQAVLQTQAKLNEASSARAVQESRRLLQDTRRARAEADMMEVESDIATSAYGRAMNYLRKTTGALGGAVAGGLTGLITGRYAGSHTEPRGQYKRGTTNRKKVLTIPITRGANR